MALIALDCGTTNSSMYVINEHDQIIGKAVRKIGVKDTAETGSTKTLTTGLREAYLEALADANISDSDITMVLSNGMITSEIGLHCLPHLTAPVSCEDLGHNMVEVGPLDIFPKNVPVYFVRGVKNRVADLSNEIDDVGLLDFMRGEETQVAGLLASGVVNPPFTLVMLSSHTKYISVDDQARIAGSVTTLSGQLYAAMAGSSVLAKSLQEDKKTHSKDFSHAVVDSAQQWTEEVGLLRSMMMVRFMDVLMQTTANERRTFMEACIASQDMMALQQFSQLNLKLDAPFVLMGKSNRSNVYEYLLKKKFGAQHPITLFVDDEAIDALTVQGLLHLARKAKLLKDKE